MARNDRTASRQNGPQSRQDGSGTTNGRPNGAQAGRGENRGESGPPIRPGWQSAVRVYGMGKRHATYWPTKQVSLLPMVAGFPVASVKESSRRLIVTLVRREGKGIGSLRTITVEATGLKAIRNLKASLLNGTVTLSEELK